MSTKQYARGLRSIPQSSVVGRLPGGGRGKGTGTPQIITLDKLSQALQIGQYSASGSGPSLMAFTDGSSGVVFLTSGTPSNIMSLTLAAGTYDVEGTVTFVPTGFSTFTDARLGLSTTSATLPTPPAKGGYTNLTGSFSVSATQFTISTGVTRIILSSGGVVFLVAQATFS